MLSEKQKEYVIEVSRTILEELQKHRNICYWGLEEGQLSGSLIFNISTEKYENRHYVRVIYDEGSNSYTIQILRDNLDHRNLVDSEVVEQIDHIDIFELVESIKGLI
ncbi:MAG: hypothetical protein RSD36_16745 [Terrisporobacter sp.]